MHEVRVESLDKLETLGGEVWISANSGDTHIVFTKHVWDSILAKASDSNTPSEPELEEWRSLKKHLTAFAKENSFEKILDGVPCGDSGHSYDLVLRSSGLYAVTTGYLFTPKLDTETIEKVRAALADDTFVEQAYLIGAAVEEAALHSGDEDLRIVSVRGRKSSASRFEMSPELWRTLSEKLGWKDMETIIPEYTNTDKG